MRQIFSIIFIKTLVRLKDRIITFLYILQRGGFTMHYQHIVIGAGSMGMAAGYFLAKSGQKTLLLDSFNPPHDKGSHHGETRLIRYAYGEGLEYVPFALRAGELWAELAEKTKKEIFLQTGIINIGNKEEPFIQNVMASANQFNLPLEVLTASDVHKKWPGLKLPENFLGCFEPTSGVLKIEDCISAYRELAIKEGAEIRTNSRVVKIQAQPDMVSIETADGTIFTANSVVISAGAWVKDLLQQVNLDLPLEPIRKTFAWFHAEDTLYGDSTFPGFSFQFGESIYYGFPSIDGTGVKVGRHDGGEPVNPDEEKQPFGAVPGDAEDLIQLLHDYMPQVGSLKFGKTCMYTMTPDEDFIIDTHPQYKNIAIAAGFSGHGFKFASAVGEILSDLVTKGSTEIDITPFSIKRF